MATKQPIYDDFEPYCQWERNNEQLVIYIPDFRKEDLKLTVASPGILKILGETRVPEKGCCSWRRTRRRFFKEVTVPEGCNVADIESILSGGKLIITMPRKDVVPTTIYEDFEPYRRCGEGYEQLVMDVPDFKKEDLKLTVATPGILKISGETPANWYGFSKEVRIPECCNVDDIKANLSGRKLTVTMPRRLLSIDDMIGFGSLKVSKNIAIGAALLAIAAVACWCSCGFQA